MTDAKKQRSTRARSGKPVPVAIYTVFMGDSITFGQYVDPPHRWSDIVSSKLTRSYLRTATNLAFVNCGISGETTRQGLERFPRDVQAATPDIMTLQFGLNDCNCWVTDRGLPRVSEAAYRANLTEMIARARRFGAQRVILSTNHPTLRHKVLLSGESLEERRLRYNELVREVAAETGVTLCDIERAFAPHAKKDLASLLLPYPDELHLSVAGHKIYAKAILPPLEEAVASIDAEKRRN